MAHTKVTTAGFDRNQLPHPEDYYQDFGFHLTGRGTWRTTCCNFCEFQHSRLVPTPG